MPLDTAAGDCLGDCTDGIEQGLGSLSLGPAEQQQRQDGDAAGIAVGLNGSSNGDDGGRGTANAQDLASARRRKLPHVNSRGSLPALGGSARSSDGPAADGGSLPAVELEDPCLWLGFSGDWGVDGPPGPAWQQW